MNKDNQSLISELAFRLILDSEEAEGYEFNQTTIDATGAEKIKNISKSVILSFLEEENTKLFLQKEDFGFDYIMASNTISNESIKIYGLSDHYTALLSVVDKAFKMKKKLSKDKDAKLLSHDFIKETNLGLQRIKEGEVGIGDYRNVDYFGEPVNVTLGYKSIQLADSLEVEKKMEELVDWTNNVAFKEGRDILHDAAEFHARFIQIHPFRDGNGRTARLLTNYLLLAHGENMVTIPLEDKEDYNHALDYINSVDLKESCAEIEGFKGYCMKKHNNKKMSDIVDFIHKKDYSKRAYKKTFSNPELVPSQEESKLDMLDRERESSDKYAYLRDYFASHQIDLNSKDSFKQILQNYSKKNAEQTMKIGKVRADQVNYVDCNEEPLI